MSKYIIELGEDANMVQVISVTQSGNAYIDSAVYVEHLEQLNSDYINEHFSDLQDDAYNKGYAQCQDDYGDALKHAKDTAYKKGFEDGKAQREHDDKIKVGDEVIYNQKRWTVFTPETNERYASLFDINGNHCSADFQKCRKTGRHFDIASILEDMRND